MNRPKVITLSDSYFCTKIINKYQNVKRNPFRFPMMIFYRNAGSILKKIKMSISLQLYFHIHNPNVSSYLIVRSVQDMRRLFSWYRVEKFIPQFIGKSSLLGGLQIANRVFSWIRRETVGILLRAGPIPLKNIPVVFLMQSIFPQIKKRTLALNKILQSSFSGEAGGSYPQTAYDALSLLETANRRILSYRDYIGIYPAGRREKVSKYSTPQYKSPTILPQTNLSLGRSEAFQDRMTLNKPFMHYNFVSAVASDANAKGGRTAFKADGEDFYFYKPRRIEEEVEEIKRIVVETKGVVEEKSVSNDLQRDIELRIKRQFDVDRISDHVYQNIERKIRMERERRGL